MKITNKELKALHTKLKRIDSKIFYELFALVVDHAPCGDYEPCDLNKDLYNWLADKVGLEK